MCGWKEGVEVKNERESEKRKRGEEEHVGKGVGRTVCLVMVGCDGQARGP